MRKHKSVSFIASAAATALAVVMSCSSPAQASDPFLGQIETFGFNFAPRGWLLCDGQLLSISQNTALFSLMGTTFGGDGRTTFGIPDLRGRVAKHVGTGPGLTPVTWGQRGGAEYTVITVNNMPAHNHLATLHATSTDGNQTEPDGHILAGDPREDQYSNATPDVTMNAVAVTTDNAGAGQQVAIRNPYIGIYHCIATVGIFPSRN
jgi:microcystin-dependent protein